MAAQDRIRLTGLLREGPPATGALSTSRRPYPASAPAIRGYCGNLTIGTTACGGPSRVRTCVRLDRLRPHPALRARRRRREPRGAGRRAGRAGPGDRPRAADRRGLGRRRGLRAQGRPAAGGGARALPDAAPGGARPRRGGRRVGPPAGGAGGDRRGGRGRPPRPRLVRRARPAQPLRRDRRGGDRGGAARAEHLCAPGSGAVALRRARGGLQGPRPAPRDRARRPRPAERLPGAAAGRPALDAAGDPVAPGDARALRDPDARRAHRSSRAPPSPTASAPPARPRGTSRAGRTARCARAIRPSGWRSGSSCPSRRPGPSSSARSAC